MQRKKKENIFLKSTINIYINKIGKHFTSTTNRKHFFISILNGIQSGNL